VSIRIADHGEDRTVTVAQLATMVGGGGGGSPTRTSLTVAYRTATVSPTVFFTALASDGSTVLVSRRSSGITQVGPFYTYTMPVTGITDFIAVWDEGNALVYEAEWIVVDT
jgi:hypothetical protein